MKLKKRLQYAAKKNNVDFHIIERDYLLSLVLEGIASIPILKKNAILKGGTALKKMYDQEYRFSEDLDFTIIGEYEYLKHNLAELMCEVCELVNASQREIFQQDMVVTSAPYIQNKPHPEGQLAFGFRARYPWHREFHTVVYAEFTFKELVVTEPVVKRILHPYDDCCKGELLVYSLEEIAGEKIRALH